MAARLMRVNDPYRTACVGTIWFQLTRIHSRNAFTVQEHPHSCIHTVQLDATEYHGIITFLCENSEGSNHRQGLQTSPKSEHHQLH